MTSIPDKPKRCFIRFSLRSLLLVTMIVCLFLGWQVERVRRQREAVRYILQLGGTVGYEYEGLFIDEPHGIPSPKLPKPAPVWLINWLGIDFFDEVVSVSLPEKKVDLSKLATLSSLRRLDLYNARPKDIAPLEKLHELEWLNLNGTAIDDLSPLQDLTQLKYLYVRQTWVSDISPLRKMTQLRSLDVSDTSVTDLSVLETLTELQVLLFFGTAVSDLSSLSDLTALGWIDIRETSVSDLAPLSQAENATIVLTKNQDVLVTTDVVEHSRRYSWQNTRR